VLLCAFQPVCSQDEFVARRPQSLFERRCYARLIVYYESFSIQLRIPAYFREPIRACDLRDRSAERLGESEKSKDGHISFPHFQVADVSAVQARFLKPTKPSWLSLCSLRFLDQ
jgi:hypothetical protein